jgi:hypothetical protein
MARWPAAALTGILASTFFAAGCGGPLGRDEEVRMLMARNRQLEDGLLASEKKVAELTAAGAKPTPLQQTAEDPFRPVAVRFSPYGGVVDTGGPVGSERLKVVLELLDATGDRIKRAGRLDLEALTPGPPGQPPRPYHQWKFSADDLRQTWLSGLGAYGYILRLPWPGGRRPEGDRLLLRARFTTLAGEVLTAETEMLLSPAAAPGAASGAAK